VACWLHDPQSGVPVPAELAQPDPLDPAPDRPVGPVDPAAAEEETS
jgi:hypothetical protein